MMPPSNSSVVSKNSNSVSSRNKQHNHHRPYDSDVIVTESPAMRFGVALQLQCPQRRPYKVMWVSLFAPLRFIRGGSRCSMWAAAAVRMRLVFAALTFKMQHLRAPRCQSVPPKLRVESLTRTDAPAPQRLRASESLHRYREHRPVSNTTHRFADSVGVGSVVVRTTFDSIWHLGGCISRVCQVCGASAATARSQ